jgi:hypothetical protein
MRGRVMMILASAVLAGSLLATDAQARGGGGGGGGDMVVAEATWAAALAEAISVASAEAASGDWAAVTWQACAESTLAVDGAISLAAVFTIMAWVAPITRHTPGPTPATTEWRVDTKAAGAGLSLSRAPRI